MVEYILKGKAAEIFFCVRQEIAEGRVDLLEPSALGQDGHSDGDFVENVLQAFLFVVESLQVIPPAEPGRKDVGHTLHKAYIGFGECVGSG